ncbi:hypothetical protein GJ744_003306 [Endocarpon pusillum]|uniref:Uncharacterized protein n=1 Tax=Endocarpon pusillum TaxID=364733 RepID=A0A8H7AA56_9EURO|nr:hypothetical protein GJ744_003306 [Endocarpon pusillum]
MIQTTECLLVNLEQAQGNTTLSCRGGAGHKYRIRARSCLAGTGIRGCYERSWLPSGLIWAGIKGLLDRGGCAAEATKGGWRNAGQYIRLFWRIEERAEAVSTQLLTGIEVNHPRLKARGADNTLEVTDP